MLKITHLIFTLWELYETLALKKMGVKYVFFFQNKQALDKRSNET